jgi:2-keto-4-pentenoate hydratase/2-oxohepta-3-ene-1,7-dioic acid hydratase in catechol pathway
MRLVSFDDYRVGVVTEAGVVDVTNVIPEVPTALIPFRMTVLIDGWDELRPKVEQAAKDGKATPMDSVRLLAPVPSPRKVYAAPANYKAHRAEMEAAGGYAGPGGPQNLAGSEEYGMFLKAPSSVVGPQDTILRPYDDRLIHHESELVMVIGKGGSTIPVDSALGHVFGYTCGLDITVRGKEDRSKRKSFDTFSPTGPWIVTADEVPDPSALEISLWVNEDLKQHAFTKDLIVDCPNLIANMSWVTRMEPGDLLFTGTPDGVGEIVPGDLVTIRINGLDGNSDVGEMSVRVAKREGLNPERR